MVERSKATACKAVKSGVRIPLRAQYSWVALVGRKVQTVNLVNASSITGSNPVPRANMGVSSKWLGCISDKDVMRVQIPLCPQQIVMWMNGFSHQFNKLARKRKWVQLSSSLPIK